MVADIGPSLHQRVDAVIDGGDGHDFNIVPGHSRARQGGVDMVPDGDVSRIFTRHALSLNIVNGLDRGVLLDYQANAYTVVSANHNKLCYP